MSEFEDIVFKYGKINRNSLIIENGEVFPSIENGIVFIFAGWSGDFIVHFMFLTETLSRLDLENLKIHVLDTDKLNYESLSQNKIINPQGYGETFWIKNHKIVHFLDSKKRDSSKIDLYTGELFEIASG